MAARLKKQEEIAQQLKQLKAREKNSERKADTRRKVAGALALEHLAKNPDNEFDKTCSAITPKKRSRQQTRKRGAARNAAPIGRQFASAPSLPACRLPSQPALGDSLTIA